MKIAQEASVNFTCALILDSLQFLIKFINFPQNCAILTAGRTDTACLIPVSVMLVGPENFVTSNSAIPGATNMGNAKTARASVLLAGMANTAPWKVALTAAPHMDSADSTLTVHGSADVTMVGMAKIVVCCWSKTAMTDVIMIKVKQFKPTNSVHKRVGLILKGANWRRAGVW